MQQQKIFHRTFLKTASLLLLFFSAVAVSAENFPDKNWETATPRELGLNERLLFQARDYALTGAGSGCVIVRGKQVLAWGNSETLYDLKSSSKSIGVTLLGIALKDGLVDWDDLAVKRHPNFAAIPEKNRDSDWVSKITLRMLANQTAGFDKPGGSLSLLFEPGTMWSYSDGGPNWLAECLTFAFQRDLNEVIFERALTPIGITRRDFIWRKNAYRSETINGVPNREFGSGISANMRAMSRIGYLYLNNGIWHGKTILPESFLNEIRPPLLELKTTPVFSPDGKNDFGTAPQHYSALWWNNADGTISEIPRNAFWAWGLHDSLIFVAPEYDLVAVRAGESWKRMPNANHYDVLKPFFTPLVSALREK
ncbi:MAG: beta-lactamase family protein [Planctomycetaceae bacterium]|jgi:CubicO group peptidase (beta-lactamase class C family)|nr:beta-lactamase family protein [Planctomycetaceae bacterium]